MSEMLSKLINELAKSDVAPAQVQICPECGGAFRISFGTYDGWYGISGKCE
jgi:ssDNA-binding Zn-finger/Zn-ribbon topoisomerase 1